MAKSPKAAAPAAPGPATQVFVRMYRALASDKDYTGWLGDCFLIRVIGPAGTSHILIDCGILLGSPDGAARMKRVTDDIIATTGGMLDLLVVTHEHWDHVSGFSQARDVFIGDDTTPPRLKIGKIWMAWTENLADPLAKDLHAKLGKRSTALANLVDYLGKNAHIAGDAGAATLGLQAFLGVDQLGATGAKLPGREVMTKLKATAPTEYCDPTHPPADPPVAGTLRGNVVATPGATPLRAFVLGPPRTKERLFKDQPSPTAPETYMTAATGANDGYRAFLAATACNEGGIVARFGAAPDAAQAMVDTGGNSPFSRQNAGYPADIATTTGSTIAADAPDPMAYRWLWTRYEADTDARTGEDQLRRRIDDDWLASSGGFALKLDSDTNNTSLVLAFELPDNTVMLFAADAQVGNWLSWHDQDYDTGDGKPVSAADLLRRTRLYKVGHHGSHNATLSDRGLGLMTHPELVALIPTDEALGLNQPGDWKMPNPRVNEALHTATKGRILRNDRKFVADPANPDDPAIKGRLREDDLFIEYQVFGSTGG